MTPVLTLSLLFMLLTGGPDPDAMDPGPTGPVGEPILVPIVSESKIWIEGSSNVNTFECIADTFQGEASTSSSGKESLSTPDQWKVQVAVPVKEMDCGQRRMNRDLFESLKAENHPDIRFEYHRTLHVENVETDLEWDRRIRLQIEGDLEVAGVTNTIQIHATGTRTNEGTLTIQGEKQILMSDFSIDPPAGLFGLIRAHDQLTVHFRIVATPATRQEEPQPTLP